MRAAFYDRTGDPFSVLQVGELVDPQAGPGEVRVRVAVSGVNPSDIKHRAGWNGLAMPHPRIVPHQDGAGVIDQAGSGVDPGRIGERVWVFEAASNGRAFGTAADYVILPAQNAVPLPDSADFQQGATLGVPAMTAHRCVFSDGSVAGQTILVAGGAGGVARNAVQLARWGGARVIATAGSEVQVAAARAAGANEVVSYRDPDVASRLAAFCPDGFDRVVEVALTTNAAMDVELVRPGGTIVAFASGGESLTLPGPRLLTKAISMKWVHVYSMPAEAKMAAITDITSALDAGMMTPPRVESYALDDIAAAHAAVGLNGSGTKTLVTLTPAPTPS